MRDVKLLQDLPIRVHNTLMIRFAPKIDIDTNLGVNHYYLTQRELIQLVYCSEQLSLQIRTISKDTLDKTEDGACHLQNSMVDPMIIN